MKLDIWYRSAIYVSAVLVQRPPFTRRSELWGCHPSQIEAPLLFWRKTERVSFLCGHDCQPLISCWVPLKKIPFIARSESAALLFIEIWSLRWIPHLHQTLVMSHKILNSTRKSPMFGGQITTCHGKILQNIKASLHNHINHHVFRAKSQINNQVFSSTNGVSSFVLK